MVKYRPLELGARPMAGRLTLDQQIGVRLLCPQLEDSPFRESYYFREQLAGMLRVDTALQRSAKARRMRWDHLLPHGLLSAASSSHMQAPR